MESKIASETSISLKVCGITQAKQALEIASLGIHAIGLIGVKESPRFVSREKRREIFNQLKINFPKVERVWVVTNIENKELDEVIYSDKSPSVIQLHGDESPKRCEFLKERYPKIKWWKAFRIKTQEDIRNIKEFLPYIDAILLDSWSEKALGGTGEKLSLDLLKEVNFNVPWWLAGGISADWIPELLSKVKPTGIDASSKLEISPGIKDIRKVKLLLETIQLSQIKSI